MRKIFKRWFVRNPNLNRELLDLCLTMFITFPERWDPRGYVKDNPPRYCLAGAAVVLSGNVRPYGRYWRSNYKSGSFHEDARELLGLTEDQAERLFAPTPYFEKQTPQEYKNYVYKELRLK